MRLPNLSVSDSITNTIRNLDLQRYKLDKQISSGQKITLPEDDGMCLGRVISLDTEKGKLAQYQRNASYASEFLNAGHLNLDNLRELNQRAQEISRVAGSSLNGPAMETYGNEIDQLIEESLNRINARHRGRSLFAGTQLKPEFGNSEVQLGKEQSSIFSLNSSFVGEVGTDGLRQIKAGEQVVISLNGREYVVEAKTDGLTTNKITEVVRDLINNDTKLLVDSPRVEDNLSYRAFVRGSSGQADPRNESVTLYSEISNNGDLVVSGTVGEKYNAKANYLTRWDPNHYYPNQIEEKRNQRAASIFDGKLYNELTESEKKQVDDYVFSGLENAPLWYQFSSYNGGDRVYDISSSATNPRLVEFDESVKGTWVSGEYALDDYTFYAGTWHKVVSAENSAGDIPHNPNDTNTFNVSNSFSAEDAAKNDQKRIIVAQSIMSGEFDSNSDYQVGQVVQQGSDFYEFNQASVTALSKNWLVDDYALGDVVRYKGVYYQSTSATTSQDPTANNFDDQNPDVSDNWVSLGSTLTALDAAGVTIPTNVTDAVVNEITNPNLAGNYFRESAFQATDEGTGEPINLLDASLLDATHTVIQESADGSIPTDSVAPAWTQNIAVGIESAAGTSQLSMTHSSPWKRLQSYELGNIIEFEGKLWESQINDNFNHKPVVDSSTYWKELPSGYDVDREDWELEATGLTQKEFFLSLDGRLFDNFSDASVQNQDILLFSDSLPVDAQPSDLTTMANEKVKTIFYPVTTYEVKGSESQGMVYFDHQTQEYRLAAAPEGSQIISSQVITYEQPVVQHEGNYFVSLDGTNLENGDKTLWSFIQDNFPPNIVEINANENLVLNKGDYLYDETTEKYYIATENSNTVTGTFDPINPSASTIPLTEASARSDGTVFKLASLPKAGEEQVFSTQNQLLQPIGLNTGDYLYHREENSYYVATETLNVSDQTDIDELLLSNKLIEVPAQISRQGTEWSSNVTYNSGDIVLYDGQYYRSLRDDFNNFLPSADFLGSTNLIYPDSNLIPSADGQSQVANYIWEVVENPLQHVLQFDATRDDAPSVNISSAGAAGTDATAKAVVDINGNIAGLKVENPGRYFFSDGIIPPDFTKATVQVGDETLEATILWQENPNDPGPYRIAGFELTGDPNTTIAPTGPRIGDTFSFATGSKTFLDHRNEQGQIVNVSYMGSENNSQFYVGKESKISSFLNSADGNTAELGNVVNTLIELREGLNNATPSYYSQEVEDSEKKLIKLEDNIIDKMGQLSANMVRMETVRAHDEDYFMQLDQRISRDLDVDLSETIMRLSRVSTAYQAAMQVGAQLLNTSLLNYL